MSNESPQPKRAWAARAFTVVEDDEPETVFKHFIIELVVLTVLIVALVFSLVLLRKRGVATDAKRATQADFAKLV